MEEKKKKGCPMVATYTPIAPFLLSSAHIEQPGLLICNTGIKRGSNSSKTPL